MASAGRPWGFDSDPPTKSGRAGHGGCYRLPEVLAQSKFITVCQIRST